MPSFTDKLTVGGSEMDMYAALPDGPGPHPAVVIAFHVGGLDDFDRKMADQLADAGFVAVVPDLFHRFPRSVMDGPRLDRLGHLRDPDIIADMNAAVDFLTANSSIDSNRLGVTGFCMGGRIAWLMAASNPIFKCTVPFYGGNIFLQFPFVTDTYKAYRYRWMPEGPRNRHLSNRFIMTRLYLFQFFDYS